MSQTSVVKRKLLIVDDERELVNVLVDEFEALGVECITAYSGTEGVQVLKSELPDAILSDIKMPDMNGLEMLEVIRRMGLHIPLIFLSGYGDKDKLVQALRLGANDFHDKPYNRKVLCPSVLKALELGASLKSLESELDTICANDPDELRTRMRDVKRDLLIMRKNREVYFKKSS